MPITPREHEVMLIKQHIAIFRGPRAQCEPGRSGDEAARGAACDETRTIPPVRNLDIDLDAHWDLPA
jgi:hypothetical protein